MCCWVTISPYTQTRQIFVLLQISGEIYNLLTMTNILTWHQFTGATTSSACMTMIRLIIIHRRWRTIISVVFIVIIYIGMVQGFYHNPTLTTWSLLQTGSKSKWGRSGNQEREFWGREEEKPDKRVQIIEVYI